MCLSALRAAPRHVVGVHVNSEGTPFQLPGFRDIATDYVALQYPQWHDHAGTTVDQRIGEQAPIDEQKGYRVRGVSHMPHDD